MTNPHNYQKSVAALHRRRASGPYSWRKAVEEGLMGGLPVGMASGVVVGLCSKPAILHAVGGTWGGLGIGLVIGGGLGLAGGLLSGFGKGGVIIGAILAALVWLAVGFLLMAWFDEGH